MRTYHDKFEVCSHITTSTAATVTRFGCAQTRFLWFSVIPSLIPGSVVTAIARSFATFALFAVLFRKFGAFFTIFLAALGALSNDLHAARTTSRQYLVAANDATSRKVGVHIGRQLSTQGQFSSFFEFFYKIALCINSNLYSSYLLLVEKGSNSATRSRGKKQN